MVVKINNNEKEEGERFVKLVIKKKGEARGSLEI